MATWGENQQTVEAASDSPNHARKLFGISRIVLAYGRLESIMGHSTMCTTTFGFTPVWDGSVVEGLSGVDHAENHSMHAERQQQWVMRRTQGCWRQWPWPPARRPAPPPASAAAARAAASAAFPCCRELPCRVESRQALAGLHGHPHAAGWLTACAGAAGPA